MGRRELNLLVNWILLAGSLVAFASGVALLSLHFHSAQEADGASAPGPSGLTWLTLHRSAASVVILGVATHVGLHWAAFRKKLSKAVIRKAKSRSGAEVTMYVAFLIAVITPKWAEIHCTLTLVLLVLVIHHIGHRWRCMTRRQYGVSVKLQRSSGGATVTSTRAGRRHSTVHIVVHTSTCTACGACTEICPNEVLQVRGPRFHRHVHIVRPQDCRGCLRCIRECPEGAIAQLLL
jgi:NAD-dependent dihydropyrimidine dehydrogenase PreA subunit